MAWQPTSRSSRAWCAWPPPRSPKPSKGGTPMFAYYFDLALRSFRRNRVLTALMVLAIALGIGGSMTTLTVFHVLSGDPIPQKSAMLFTPQLDPQGMDGFTPGEDPDDQLTRYDAERLLREAKGDRQALMTGGGVRSEERTLET